MRLFHLSLVFAVAALMSSATIVRAGETPAGATRVEEDWELVISEPDFEGVGPQITTCMTAEASGTSRFVAFNLNYRANPLFLAGGVHILVWDDEEVVDLSSHESGRCNTTNEQITWTQRLNVSDESIHYSVRDGHSTTWGNFGVGHGLSSVNTNSSAETLALYDPDYSASQSGVGWQKNRVTKLTLLRVRYYDDDNDLITTDSQPRPVIDNASN